MTRFPLLAVALLLVGGCASFQAARTDVHVDLPDGRRVTYSSSKDQAGIDLTMTEVDPRTGLIIKRWIVKVEKSNSPEAAYVALAEQQRSLTDLMKAFLPLVEKAARGLTY